MEDEIKINTIGQLLDYVETEEKANELIYYITNLQDTLQDREEYIGHLEELCNKYEEEHSTTFNEWKETITDKYQTLKDLQEENEKVNKELDYADNYNIYLISKIDNAKSLTNRTIEIIKQQPSGNDEWILERLNGINYCLGGDEEC
jgi:DNA repair ATPase RecN